MKDGGTTLDFKDLIPTLIKHQSDTIRSDTIQVQSSDKKSVIDLNEDLNATAAIDTRQPLNSIGLYPF